MHFFDLYIYFINFHNISGYISIIFINFLYISYILLYIFLLFHYILAPFSSIDLRTERALCIQLVKSKEPMLELVEDGKLLSYRCKICRTASQKEGKLNKLGKAKLKAVKHFLEQHLSGSTHKKNEMKWNLQQQKEADGADGSEPAPDQKEVVQTCPGYLVSPESHGTLGLFGEEFRLWATHNKLTSSKHTYWIDVPSQKYLCRHHSCTGQTLPGTRCCRMCNGLGDPKGGVQRCVLRFAAKYNASVLLMKRLFFGKDEALAFEAQIQQTTWGNRSDQWGKMVKCQNHELQAFVRKSWSFIGSDEYTPNLFAFIDSVVTPSLNVNVHAVNDEMQTVFKQYTRALAGLELTVFWLHFAGHF